MPIFSDVESIHFMLQLWRSLPQGSNNGIANLSGWAR